MKASFASLSIPALSIFAFLVSTGSAVNAQTVRGLAPTRPLEQPLGLPSATGGIARPLGGIPAGRGIRGEGRGGSPYGYTSRRWRGGYGFGAYGFSTYVPAYGDYLPEAPTGPYSYTFSPYPAAPPPLPPEAVPVPAGPQPPAVIINQYYGYPPPPGGEAGEANPQAEQPQPQGAGAPLTEPQNYYLIVYKDHSVHAALAYWVEGNTLNYVTTDNAHNQVSLDLVDIPETTRLNSDHRVPFSIAAR